ncbi:uncharacterized protein EV420DRAFT_1642372 [Desarmillaria tabescens]|uniref:DUF6535 domain-containing protein n=1 Tax=Armillaria tabescens TaxID=1929756 RepID=A0AA39N612_ARMTA|nr:uncharacterized protein EV420DRAFT_1642372 [Desarmillaria tabescens]KAK0459391.1 hypothetical protein EV420DRAFT_1642372 [Desarmillaria tabescens]
MGIGNPGSTEEDERHSFDEEEIHPLPVNASHAKFCFRMKKRQFRQGNDLFDYEDKYPEDPIYHETAPNARVWRTYADENVNFDVKMVEDSRDNVDVLLVFAGLFSAVVSTFIIQASQSLSADYTQMSASFLFELVAIQRALASGAAIDTSQHVLVRPFFSLRAFHWQHLGE